MILTLIFLIGFISLMSLLTDDETDRAALFIVNIMLLVGLYLVTVTTMVEKETPTQIVTSSGESPEFKLAIEQMKRDQLETVIDSERFILECNENGNELDCQRKVETNEH